MSSEIIKTLRTRKLAKPEFIRLVPETDTGGRDEYSQARERTPVKELCKILL